MRARFVIALLVAGLLLAPWAQAADGQNCHVGAYRLADGSVLDIGPSEGAKLRWRMFSGETGELHQKDDRWLSTLGWSDRADGHSVTFASCRRGTLRFDRIQGRRIAFSTTDTTFVSHEVTLAGRLVMPKGKARVPVVILVHGSEQDSALQRYTLQRLFPSQGIGVFVYDKRGTGASGGNYTHNFDVLADDAVNAVAEARRLAGTRAGRVGYQGGSQGGWVVPLAANRTKVDFAVVSFGLAVTVLEEDQQSVALDMHFHHHEADTPQALLLARAGERVIETGGREGYAEFDALRQTARNEPWYKDVHGDFLFFILPLDKAGVDAAMKEFNFQTPFRYEPMPALEASTTPQLWVLGEDDMEAPSAETGQRIKALISYGRRFTLAMYPGVEHGMTEYELDQAGNRVSTRYAAGYFQMMADFINHGRVDGSYGSAQITQPAEAVAR